MYRTRSKLMSTPTLKNATALGAAMGLAFAAATTTAHAADVKLRYAGTLPTTHHISEGMVRFADRVRELTNGAVEIELYPAGQLYKAREIPTAIVSGGADIGLNLTSVWATDPVSEMNDLPFLYRDNKHAAKAWDPDGKMFKAFAAEMDKRGMKTIHTMFFGSLFDFGNNGKLLKEAGDFQGMKIRGYGRLAAEGLRALGASPVVMSPGEMYLAIQRGTIDGAITGVTSLESRKIWEVVEFSTITGATFGVMGVNMSKVKWDALSSEQQEAVMTAGKDVYEWSVDESARRDKASTEFVQSKGVTTHILTPEEKTTWRELFKPAYEAWNARATDEHRELLKWVESL